MKKAQFSMEFLLIFGISLFVLCAFLVIIHRTVTELHNDEDRVHMQNLANVIRKEVLLASQVHHNYIRRFVLPPKLNGKNYTLRLLGEDNLLKSGIEINLTDNAGRVVQSEFYVLPSAVKGQFTDIIEKGGMEHCITKNEQGDIRIARNQASIEFISLTTSPQHYDLSNIAEKIKQGKLVVSVGDEFEVAVRVSCVENVQALKFVLGFTSDTLAYISPHCEEEPQTNKPDTNIVLLLQQGNNISVNATGGDSVSSCSASSTALPNMLHAEQDRDALFKQIYSSIYYDRSSTKKYWEPVDEDGDGLSTITGGFIAYDFETGSGNIAKLRFRVKASGAGEILFHQKFDDNLVILDRKQDPSAIERLPASKIGAGIIIN